MSKVEHNGIYYDPKNEIVCDKRALNNLIAENEHYKKQIADLEAKLAEKDAEIEELKKSRTYIMNFGNKVKEVKVVDDDQDKISFAVE